MDGITLSMARATLSPHELLRRFRRPLPRHDLRGVPFRAWALSVCNAEVTHRRDDFIRAANEAGFPFDLYASPTDVNIGSYEDEATADYALQSLMMTQTMDSDRWGPWARVRWAIWSREEKLHHLRSRKRLLGLFIRAVHDYSATRAAFDAPVVAREAA